MSPISLPPRCDRATVESLLPEFVAAMGAGAIRIDASQVTHAGQALLQLLVGARRSIEGLMIEPSPALRDAAALTGLTHELFEETRA
ncbi:MAG: STAS domain-containing protein [Sphingomonadales bacterium]|nr:STAS domain-containing protein [Sphingomonadales bacterium]